MKLSFLEKNENYCNDIENFEKYLETQVDGASFYQPYTLRGMTVDGIIDSLKYYVEIGQIKKKEPARKYTSAISQWFEFLFENSDIRNEALQDALRSSSNRKNSYLYQCKHYIDNCNLLKEKETYPALTDGQVFKILEWCNNSIQSGLVKTNKDISFKRMTAALCIKLMLFIGIAYRVARAINFGSYNECEGTLIVNDYIIRLPLRLTRELKEYKCICKDKGFDVQKGFLFTTPNGDQWGEKTSHLSIPTFLNSQLGINSVNSVVKYGVQQLILQNVSDSIILRLTGVRKEILEDCADPNIDSDGNVYAYINSKIVNSPIYQQL